MGDKDLILTIDGDGILDATLTIDDISQTGGAGKTTTFDVIPTKELQNITPDEGYVFRSGKVQPIPDEYYDTSDATATAEDILEGKTGYTADGKVDGTLKQGIFPDGVLTVNENSLYDVYDYAQVEVDVPMPDGDIEIAENGVFDVKQYATAIVEVPEPAGTIQITENGTVNVSPYAKANVAVPMPPVKKDINFYDYDGTLIAGWTREELAEASELPANPSHDGLTAQGWNWTLEQLKAEVATGTPWIDVGQMYITDDGKTRLYITIPENSIQMTPTLSFGHTGSTVQGHTWTIDWGDGNIQTQATTNSLLLNHTYANAGDYIITLECSSDATYALGFGSNAPVISDYNVGGRNSRLYFGWLTKIELGQHATLGNIANMASLKAITTSTDSPSNLVNYISGCIRLTFLVIPSGISNISSLSLGSCYNITGVSIPQSVSSIPATFLAYTSIERFALTSNITTVNGASTFANIQSLKEIYLPPTLTLNSNSNFISNSYVITELDASRVSGSFGVSVCMGCFNLRKVRLPRNQTTIGNYFFQNCSALTDIEIPEATTAINQWAFGSCSSLSKITIPSGVASIGDYVFYVCNSLTEIHMKPTTPPRLGSSVFPTNVQQMKIIVPQGSGNAYKSATNWSTYASKIVEEE